MLNVDGMQFLFDYIYEPQSLGGFFVVRGFAEPAVEMKVWLY